MSTFVTATATCPHCGHATGRELAVGVHGGRAHPIRQAVMDGTFQRFVCPGCRLGYRVEEPMTWIDPDRKLFLMVFPTRDEPRWAELEGESARLYRDNVLTNASPLATEVLGDLWVRTVFGLDALREKLVVAELGLDDRVLEAFKLEAIRALGAVLNPGLRPRLVGGDAEVLTLAMVVGEPYPEARAVPREAYDRIAASLAHQPLIERLGAGPYVDLGRIMLGRTAEAAPASAPQSFVTDTG